MKESSQAFELLTLSEIFASGARQLRVPDYQRGYSWEEEQRSDLIDDIKQIVTQKHRHFTGTVVASTNHESSVFDLVDGQQRITSLVILMSCLLRVARDRGLTMLGSDELLDIESIYIRSGIETGNTRYQLQLGDVRDPLFHEVLIEGEPKNQTIKNKADQNIVDAAAQFSECLFELDEQRLSDFYCAVTQQLGFLLYAPEQDAEIGIMFEVINNRGKPLSELEKIKNYLIYFAGRHNKPDLKSKVNASWPVLLESLNIADYTSNDDENRFLRVCWLVFKDHNKKRSHHVYDNLKSAYKPDEDSHWRDLCDFVDFVVGCAQTYAKLHKPELFSTSLSNDEQTYLERIASQPANASVLPLVVAVFSSEKSSEKRACLLDIIEKLNFRYYITGIANRNDTGQGELFEMAHAFYNDSFEKTNDELNADNYTILKDRLVSFVNDNANDYKFVQYLTLDHDEAGDYYKWRGLRFFMGSYEDSLLTKNRQSSQLARFIASRDKVSPNDFYHQEHIWARKELTVVDDKHDLDINKRRLGNFILLMETINIKVSDHRIELKIKEYFQGTEDQPNTLMIRELSEDFSKAEKFIEDRETRTRKTKRHWYEVYTKFLDIREQRLVNFAIMRWAVEGMKRPVTEVKLNSDSGKNEIFECLPKYSDKNSFDADKS